MKQKSGSVMVKGYGEVHEEGGLTWLKQRIEKGEWQGWIMVVHVTDFVGVLMSVLYGTS